LSWWFVIERRFNAAEIGVSLFSTRVAMSGRTRFRISLVSFLVFPLSAYAQHTPPPVAVTTMPHPVVTRPDSIQDTGLYGYWSKMTNQDRAGGALLGKVTIQGEMLPWEPILVTVDCKDSTVYATQTDSKGEFAIIPKGVPGEVSQQGDTQRQMKAHYEGCVLQGLLTGFQSSKVIVTERNLRDDPEVGTITLTRDASARATATSATSLSAPPGALKHWSKAGIEMLAGKPDRARKELGAAVHSYPQFADAWYELGRLEVMSDPRDARLCMEKAIAADANFVRPFGQLAVLASLTENWQGVLENTSHSLQLEPEGTIWIWYYDALANFELGNVDSAEKSAKKLVAMDPLHSVRGGEQLLAAILARKADYAGALAHLRSCLNYIQDADDVNLLKQEIAQLERRAGKSN
jgi:tetratricopeptide (TPR) repeat protein